MKTKALIVSLFSFVIILFCSTIYSQSFGVRAGLYTDPEDPFIGFEYLNSIGNSVYLNPNIEYIFFDNGTYMTFNLDAHYDFSMDSDAFIWAGGGLGLLYFNPDGPPDSDTNPALNLLLGIGLKTQSRLVPYLQG